jgi:hypothetical protein
MYIYLPLSVMVTYSQYRLASVCNGHVLTVSASSSDGYRFLVDVGRLVDNTL